MATVCDDIYGLISSVQKIAENVDTLRVCDTIVITDPCFGSLEAG